MNFSLTYEGAPGSIAATLTADGKTVDTTTELGSGREARKWAKNAAAQHKTSKSVDPSQRENTTVHVSGNSVFSL